MKLISVLLFSTLATTGCSHSPEVKQEAYAKLATQKTFESDMPTTWKAIEDTFHNFKVMDRNPNKIDNFEMKKLTKRTLETDWIYGQSRDKYVNYLVNGTPRHKNLQTRVKYVVTAATQIGGVDVSVETREEIERLKSDGSPDGFDTVDDVDPSRPSEILNKIQNSLLSAAP